MGDVGRFEANPGFVLVWHCVIVWHFLHLPFLPAKCLASLNSSRHDGHLNWITAETPVVAANGGRHPGTEKRLSICEKLASRAPRARHCYPKLSTNVTC